jgi:CheY-like chemotaxis protein
MSLAQKHVIIYADDDPDDLELVKEAFDDFANNVEVITFSDGAQAVNYLSTHNPSDPAPCLIILDVNMPIMDGKQALIRIREMDRFNSVPVVLFTTSSLPSDKTFAGLYNAGFMTKPLNLQQMEKITDAFIEHCASDIQKKIRKQMQ